MRINTSELNPCKCGNDCFLVVIYRNRIEIKCPVCNTFKVTYSRHVFNTMAKCIKNVWPVAVKEWNVENA